MSKIKCCESCVLNEGGCRYEDCNLGVGKFEFYIPNNEMPRRTASFLKSVGGLSDVDKLRALEIFCTMIEQDLICAGNQISFLAQISYGGEEQ